MKRCSRVEQRWAHRHTFLRLSPALILASRMVNFSDEVKRRAIPSRVRCLSSDMAMYTYTIALHEYSFCRLPLLRYTMYDFSARNNPRSCHPPFVDLFAPVYRHKELQPPDVVVSYFANIIMRIIFNNCALVLRLRQLMPNRARRMKTKSNKIRVLVHVSSLFPAFNPLIPFPRTRIFLSIIADSDLFE
ncbi:hypothetical protein U1Q18_048515 [Sarracenia purpurea var. burkii]